MCVIEMVYVFYHIIEDDYSTAIQRQNAVYSYFTRQNAVYFYFTSKHILLFAFAEQYILDVFLAVAVTYG